MENSSFVSQAWTWLSYWVLSFLVPIATIFLVIKFVAKKNLKRVDEQYKKSFENQEAMIGLLREIRDSLKK